MNKKERFAIFSIFLVICLIVAVFSGYFGTKFSSLETFASVNHYLAATIYSLLFILLSTFSFSVSVMTSFGTIFFSGYEVVIYSMIGILGSSIIDFYISRKLGRDYARQKIEQRGGKLEKFEEILEKDTFKTILILSAIFFIPPIIPNLLGGVMKIKLKDYLAATILGNLPNTFFTVYFIKGLLYGNAFLIYGSFAGLIAVGFVSVYFYKGELREILRLGFPWFFRNKN